MVAKLKVEGQAEVVRAFDKVESAVKDMADAHKAEANMLLPDVRSASRKGASGDLIAGWQSDGIAGKAQFINDVAYAGVQEWGWDAHNISPTHAIIQAFEANSSNTEALYGDAIRAIGSGIGFHVK